MLQTEKYAAQEKRTLVTTKKYQNEISELKFVNAQLNEKCVKQHSGFEAMQKRMQEVIKKCGGMDGKK